MNLSNFPFALERALIEWRGAQTRKRESVSLKGFADYLGYSQSIVSQWLNRDKTPSRGTAELIFPKLVELLGYDAYEILEMPRPDPYLERITRIWNLLPEEAREKLAAQGERFAKENEATGISTKPIRKTP